MHISFNATQFQRALASVIAVVIAAWWLTVPGLVTPSTFVALVGFLAAFMWVLNNTIENAQPASSLAQSLHDVETTAASRRAASRSLRY
jgi:UPF0716 family protein affecting phage T7 exclusion